MKFLICSDIHGDYEAAKKTIDIFEEERCDRLVILGDILYHGPRNDLPENYAPKKVIALFNEYKDKILSVRGNCDTEVDQMVLEFPVLADYAYLVDGEVRFFLTHGHKFNLDAMPPISAGDVLLHGHTHVLKIEKFGNDNYYINPGSVSLPKENNPKTFAIYENNRLSIMDFKKNIIKSITFPAF
ncbi:MAG: phosphodiesterase [Clostridia bacterium]|nr:phosphodiesterase [Clostridia bacterium]